MPLLPQPVFNQGSESSGSVPHHLPLEESQPEDDENGHAASGDLPSDPALGVDARNGHAASGDLPYDSTLGVDARNAHLRPCWSAYSFFFEERFYMFRNLPSQSMGEFVRLIEESWGRLTEAERGVYTDQERMDRERCEIELNEYQERTGRTQSK